MTWARADLALCHYQGRWVDPDGDATRGIAPGSVHTVSNVANIAGHLALEFKPGSGAYYKASCFTRIPPDGAVEGFEEPRRVPLKAI